MATTSPGPGARSLVGALLADPPLLHQVHGPDVDELGLWEAERSCYHFLADRCPPGAVTLETGLGLSTLVLVAMGAQHTCVTHSAAEADRLLAACRQRGLATDRLHLLVGPSDQVLPGLDLDDVDLYLIDGGHGFPIPMLDWFYGASRLKEGGVVVLDDVNLPAVAMLSRYLDSDPRWRPLVANSRWAAWERTRRERLTEDHWEQPLFRWENHPGLRSLSQALLGEVAQRLSQSVQKADRRTTTAGTVLARMRRSRPTDQVAT